MSDFANVDPNDEKEKREQPQHSGYGELADAGSLASHTKHADNPSSDGGGSRDSLLARANNALIKYPRFRDLHQSIRRCQELSTIAGEPQCMALEGQTGAGKSTLVREYAKAFPREETVDGTHVTVLYMETPSPVTVKGMAAFMLESLGDPAAHRGTLWSMNSRLVKLIRACGVELVILDDFHHLVDAKTEHILMEVSEWLKVLIKETGIPFLVVGIVGRVEQVLKANSQLSRLFASREVLQPFYWNPADPKGSAEFIQFVRYAETAVGLHMLTSLGKGELLSLLHKATDGVVANVMNLLRYAQHNALERGSDHIGLPDLSWAYNERLAKHLSRPDPFAGAAVESERSLPPSEGKKNRQANTGSIPATGTPSAVKQSAKGGKGGKGSDDNLGNVLRAS